MFPACFFGEFMLLYPAGQEFSKNGKLLMEKQKTEGGYMKERLLQWHPAFLAGLQIELVEDAPYLEFEGEHLLGAKPLQIDVLIIKKVQGQKIQKNIGQIFSTYNIVEYKSPEKSLGIDDFYKVYGYACIYKSEAKYRDEIKAEEITISFVCHRYPRKLLRYLREQNRKIGKREDGIYDIPDTLFRIQLIVTQELTTEKNLWLKSLTNDLKSDGARSLLYAYKGHQEEKLYEAVMNVIVRANKERFEVGNMCEALEEILEKNLKEKEQMWVSQGKRQKLLDQIKKKLKKGKSVSQIAEELEEAEDVILPLYLQMKTEQ